MGAPSRYSKVIEPNMELIAAWIRDGLSQAQIAKNLKVNSSTISLYRKEHPELEQLFQENRQRVDLVHVVGSYFKLCTGYTVVEETRHYKTIDGHEELVERYEKEKYIPPNPNCTENWIRARLKNDEVWGSFAADTRKTVIASEEETEEGGLVFVPAKTKAADEKIIDVEVKEVRDE